MEAGLRSHFDYASSTLPQKILRLTALPLQCVHRRKNFGRHDWTRTNDPYHVKVVL